MIQEWLKLPSAWWEAHHVDAMLALRVVMANQPWEDYWESTKARWIVTVVELSMPTQS